MFKTFEETESLPTSDEPDPPSKEYKLPTIPNLHTKNRNYFEESTNIPSSSRSDKESLKTTEFRKIYYPDVTDHQWDDWRWQLNNRIKTIEQISKITDLAEVELKTLIKENTQLQFAITPYYASLLEKNNFSQPIRKSIIPRFDECIINPGEAHDPLNEEGDSPVPGIVHRYPDRVLFLTTGFCSVYCRYCTRSRMVGDNCKTHFNREKWANGIKYIMEHSEIRDVLLSGGDPLTLPTKELNWLLTALRNIKHVQIIRIGTKVPVVLPQRINRELVNTLKLFHPLYISIHFTHPEELTRETAHACNMLADAGIPLGSQTVLLNGINDNVETMKSLMQGLLEIRVRPYYLYQCDPIAGSAHFRTPVSKGLDIIQNLRGHTTGYAVPNYVIDAPGGGGKIPLLPEYVIGCEDNNIILKNYSGNLYKYPDIV